MEHIVFQRREVTPNHYQDTSSDEGSAYEEMVPSVNIEDNGSGYEEMVPSIEITTEDSPQELHTQANLAYHNHPVQPNIAYNSKQNRAQSPGSDSLQYDYTSPRQSRENIASPMEKNNAYSSGHQGESHSYDYTNPMENSTRPGEALVYDYTSAVEANRGHNSSLEVNGAYTAVAESSCPSYDEIDKRPQEPPPHYEYVTNEQLYAEVGGKRRHMRQGRALCRFWQGRMEIAARLIILVLGVPILALPIIALTSTDINALSSTAAFWANVIAICSPIALVVVGCIELALALTRICVEGRNSCTSCMLTWDAVHSIILGIAYFAASTMASWMTTAFATSSPLDADPNVLATVVAVYSILTVLSFMVTMLYFLKAGWIIVYMNCKKDIRRKVEDVLKQNS